MLLAPLNLDRKWAGKLIP